MKKVIVILLAFLWVTSCINHTVDEDKKDTIFPKNDDINIKYASHFNVDLSQQAYTKITINSSDSKFLFEDSIFIPHSPNFEFGKRKLVKKQYQSIAIQSATYISYLQLIGKDTLIKGLSGLDYISSNKVKHLLNTNGCVEISSNGQIILENLLKINPDLFFIYPFELESGTQYAEQGIETVLIAEYLEKTPLARLEWIKLFGLIFNEYSKSNSVFNAIEKEYLTLKQDVDTSKTFFFNLPYKDNWAMPSSQSVTTNLVKDAGLNYIYQTDSTNDNLILSPEIVWNDAINTKYWIIIASRPENFNLKELIAEQEVYKEFESVKNRNVIFCNTSTTEYFTKGPVEPQIMLSNLIECVNHSTDSTKYFRVLK